MVRVRPFAALRPPVSLVEEVSALPYDVLNTEEAAEAAGPKSLLHITRPEIDFHPSADEHEDRVYRHGCDNFCTWQERGFLLRDPQPSYYVYGQTMGNHEQYGIVLCAHTDDYFNGTIKKHEYTRKDKEDGRMKHILMQDANLEPVFFCFRDNERLAAILEDISDREPVYDFTSRPDGFRHRLWTVTDASEIEAISSAFKDIPVMYIADGHHRSAAAARVGKYKAAHNPRHNGSEEYNWFMAVCFPASQLNVMDYNRLIKDLNGLSYGEFLSALEKDYRVEAKASAFKPLGRHNFALYMDGKWYSLWLKDGLCDESDPLSRLDSGILSRTVLDPILGIKDLRTDERIDFVGGIRGIEDPVARVDSGEMAAAIFLYPVSMEEIMAVADAGEVMPPKSTWFEPKLRSGLFIHTLYEE